MENRFAKLVARKLVEEPAFQELLPISQTGELGRDYDAARIRLTETVARVLGAEYVWELCDADHASSATRCDRLLGHTGMHAAVISDGGVACWSDAPTETPVQAAESDHPEG